MHNIIIYVVSYAASFILAAFGYHYLSGAVLILLALYLYWCDYHKTYNAVHLRALFALFWIGGQGISCLKLSRLQTEWKLLTWICFFLTFAVFWSVFEIMEHTFASSRSSYVRRRRSEGTGRPLLTAAFVLTGISLTAFILEAVVLGYIPFFVRGVPHAYSEFHITGVHYFTVSCVLVPSLSILYFCADNRKDQYGPVIAILVSVASLLIPILCVSRFQFIFAMILAVLTWMAVRNHINIGVICMIVVLMIPVYIVLTIARSHDVSYLNSIFEMKNQAMPIFISQPYIYIANNYDNFNCLVENLPEHSFGIRSLFPLWALTGLKFVFHDLIKFPLYVNKPELTTLTLIYDFYYDFGVAGVIAASALLGLVCYWLVSRLRQFNNPVLYLFYAQIAAYLILSFFTSWFSNPTTWFYLIITGIICYYVSRKSH